MISMQMHSRSTRTEKAAEEPFEDEAAEGETEF